METRTGGTKTSENLAGTKSMSFRSWAGQPLRHDSKVEDYGNEQPSKTTAGKLGLNKIDS